MIASRDHEETFPSLALVGCGAVVEALYMPAILSSGVPGNQIWLADRVLNRALAVAGALNVPEEHCTDDYRRVLSRVDAAIVAAPPGMHYTIVKECLEHGIHVLCEKPFTETSDEGHDLVELAAKSDLILAVNNTRRVSPAARKVRELVSSGKLGEIREIEYYEGGTFGWPTVSGFYFDHRVNTKGVLMDRGSHVLDLLCWWLGARPQLVEYYDDSFGGPEAMAKLRLEHAGCKCTVMLSWLSKLRNTFWVTGERGSVGGAVYDWRSLTMVNNAGERPLRLRGKARTFKHFIYEVVNNFIQCIQGQAQPLIPASEVMQSIDLIDECYRRRKRFTMTWYEELEAINEI